MRFLKKTTFCYIYLRLKTSICNDCMFLSPDPSACVQQQRVSYDCGKRSGKWLAIYIQIFVALRKLRIPVL